MVVISLDLGPNHTGFCIFAGEDRLVHFGTILPPLDLSVVRRCQYTVGILRMLCQVYDVQEAALEDYAHKLRSAAVTSLREQGGAIKQAMIDGNIKIYIYNVSVIKKFATGFGRAQKGDMARTLRKMKEPMSRDKVFRLTTHLRRVVSEDVVDAWFIGKLHFDNVRRILLDETPWPVTVV